MNPITIKIAGAVCDAFLYMGKLFILNNDGHLRYIDNDVLHNNFLKLDNADQNLLLRNLFFKNDMLEDPYRPNVRYKKYFDEFWASRSSRPLEIEIPEDDFISVCKLPEKEALDFVMYGQRAYIANRDGLFECQLSFVNDNVHLVDKNFERIFDSKAIHINPRLGRILISANDGLFSGSIHSLGSKTEVSHEPVGDVSVRTGWAQFNFVNYSSSVEAEFFINETEEIEDNQAVNFTADDNINSNTRIKTMGIEKRPLSDAISKADINKQVVFAFNSLSNSFVITNSGKVMRSSFSNNMHDNQTLESYSPLGGREVIVDLDRLGYPLSGHAVSNGTIVEFFNKIVLLKNGIAQEISDIECQQLRTFPSSKWYKNLTVAVAENHIEIHSIYPFRS